MTKNIVEINENGIEVLASGNEETLVKAWNEEKGDWIGWISEQEPEKHQELKETEVQDLIDLEGLFETELDYDWYKLVVMTDEELEELNK